MRGRGSVVVPTGPLLVFEDAGDAEERMGGTAPRRTRASMRMPGAVLPGMGMPPVENQPVAAARLSRAAPEDKFLPEGLVEGEDGILFPKEEEVPTVKETFGNVFEMAVPMAICLVLVMVNEVVNTVVVGRVGSGAQLAAVGIGNMMQNCCGLSIGLGLSSALDTFVSQAYGAGEHEVCHRSLHRCRILMTLVLVFIIPPLWFSEEILLLLKQDPEIAMHAASYNKVTAFGLFAFFQKDALGKFLTNQNNPWPPTAVGFFTTILHGLWAWLFVCHLGYGNAGLGMANCVTWYLQFIALSILVAREAEGMGFNARDVLWGDWPNISEFQEYLKVGGPAVLALCSEWWVWEICALVVGYLGAAQLAAHVSTINFFALLVMTTVGYQIAVTTLVGNAVGANKPRTARRALGISMICIMGNWAIYALPVVFGRQYISKAYSSDPEVQGIMEKMLLFLVVAWFFDSIQMGVGGAMRAMGMQEFVAGVFLFAFYGVMLPLGVFLAFHQGLAVLGFWISFGVGTFAAAVLMLAKCCTLDMAKICADAAASFQAEEEQNGQVLKDENGEDIPLGTTMI